MNRLHIDPANDVRTREWVPFPGGELEGTPPRALCAECRERLQRQARGERLAPRPALCFQCYRADLERNRAIRRAAELDTASEARFQGALPFEPVNRARLARLRQERTAVQAAARSGTGRFVERRVRAQIEARHALARVLAGVRERRSLHAGSVAAAGSGVRAQAAAAPSMSAHAYPASWLPFVVAQ
ncbi:MAG: hypothetical protein AB7Q29_15485 [Vicinamibacterales bacterium]